MASSLRHGALSLEAINPRLIRVDRKALLEAGQNRSFCSLILALIRQVKHTNSQHCPVQSLLSEKTVSCTVN